jgi:glycine/D-amino acid oxidase-like deaminating enzyme
MNKAWDPQGPSQSLDVVIVGAGIVGLCIAWHLSRRGAAVTIFDPNPPGSGCSSGNAGALSAGSVVPLAMPGLLRSVPAMLFNPKAPLHIPIRYWLKASPWLAQFVGAARPTRVAHIAEALSSLYHPAIERHREILAELDALDLIRTDGQLYVYRNQGQLNKDREAWDLRRRHGVRVEEIDRREIARLEPAVSSAYQIGIFLPDQGMSANPLRQANAIADGLRRRGVRFVRESVESLTVNGQRVDGVNTATGKRSADVVVVAAGAWSASLLQSLGYRIPLESQRGYHIDIPAPGVTVHRPIIPADRKVFVSPMETGLRVAGTVEFGGLKAPPSPKRAHLLLDDLTAVLPDVPTNGHTPYWMGHRPCLPDSLPVLGESARWGGLWFGFGHGHLGLTASAVTGDVIARGIFRERLNLDLRPFAAERFSGSILRRLGRHNPGFDPTASTPRASVPDAGGR